MDIEINPSIGEKTFFCPGFRLSIKFLKNGLITGILTHFPTTLRLKKKFKGFYCQGKKNLKFAFFIEWADANLASKALTCFSGKICNYQDDSKLLILKWLQINETYTKIGSYLVHDSAILTDSYGGSNNVPNRTPR